MFNGPISARTRYACAEGTRRYSELPTILNCSLPEGGGGQNLTFTMQFINLYQDGSNGSVTVGLDAAGRFSFPDPTISDGSLCFAVEINGDYMCDENEIPKSKVIGKSSLADIVQFHGTNFPLNRPTAIPNAEFYISYGSYRCEMIHEACTRERIVCRTEQGVSEDPLTFQLHVGNVIVDSNLAYEYPGVPTISNVTGCTNEGKKTVDCPTKSRGGSPAEITINGEDFSGDFEVFIGPNKAVTKGSSTSTRIVVLLPEGGGQDLFVRVENIDNEDRMISQPNDFLSYGLPVVMSISGCSTATKFPKFINCPRGYNHSEGGNNKIILTGINFGPSNQAAGIIIGSKQCQDVRVSTHDTVTCR